VTITRQQVFNVLKSLPMIRFALMLGGGVVSTGLVAWIFWLIGHGKWPVTEGVAIARIGALQWLGLGGLLIIAIVMIALAFGQLGKATVGVGGVQVDLDFDNPESGAPK
jgi:hypothetical protein